MISTPSKHARLLLLDVFRGITVMLMIIVNSPGNHTAYRWLEHSDWNGCTLADLVFPFFIYVVGISLAFTLSKAQDKGLRFPQLFPAICKRALYLFAIGLLLNAFPHHFDFTSLRFYGVLQRIAICYLVASWLFLRTSVRTQALIVLALLAGYYLLMTAVPVPGYGINQLTPTGNWAAFLDRMMFSSSHLYGKVFDPEGFLSTLPAIATALLGNLTGVWLMSANSPQKKLLGMVSGGLVALLTGWLWALWFPINKALWTSSYVLWTGGFALLMLTICYWLIEIKAWKSWARPFTIFGLNAMLAYILHVLFLKIQAMISLPQANGTPGNARLYITEHLFGWASLPNSSLLYALAYTLLWLVMLLLLNSFLRAWKKSSLLHS